MSPFAAALIVSVLAGGASMALLMYFVKYRPDLLPVGVMASAAVRLLLMMAGTVIFLFFAKVDAIWFVAWVGAFYIVMLVWEIRFALRAVNKVKTYGGDKV